MPLVQDLKGFFVRSQNSFISLATWAWGESHLKKTQVMGKDP